MKRRCVKRLGLHENVCPIVVRVWALLARCMHLHEDMQCFFQLSDNT